jgi:hypothetical protein
MLGCRLANQIARQLLLPEPGLTTNPRPVPPARSAPQPPAAPTPVPSAAAPEALASAVAASLAPASPPAQAPAAKGLGAGQAGPALRRRLGLLLWAVLQRHRPGGPLVNVLPMLRTA